MALFGLGKKKEGNKTPAQSAGPEDPNEIKLRQLAELAKRKGKLQPSETTEQFCNRMRPYGPAYWDKMAVAWDDLPNKIDM